MLYRPNFCANCGEKIERIVWGLLTSRRFCGVCESEYKGTDLIPRVIVVVGALVGVLGIGGYLRSGPSGDAVLLRQPKKAIEQTVSAASSKTAPETQAPSIANANTVSGQPSGQVMLQTPKAVANLTQSTQDLNVRSQSAEPVYYCGAETKKGTPCSRRVKGNVRCFQHTGMPAMESADKLKIN